MLKKYQRLLLLLSCITSLGGLAFIIYTFPPSTHFPLGIITIPILVLFFPLLGLAIFSSVTFFSRRPVFGALISALVLLYLLLRMAGLTHPFFLFLLIALFITFLLLFKKEQ